MQLFHPLSILGPDRDVCPMSCPCVWLIAHEGNSPIPRLNDEGGARTRGWRRDNNGWALNNGRVGGRPSASQRRRHGSSSQFRSRVAVRGACPRPDAEMLCAIDGYVV